MNSKLLWSAAAIVLLAGMVSCQKWTIFSKEIRFNAISAETLQTRTAYSGEVASNWERINWVNGDQIRMYSDKAKTKENQSWADYTVDNTSITADGRYSQTKLSGSGLLWGEGLGTYHFWGIYPSHAISVSAGTGTVSGLAIAAAQDVIEANKTVITSPSEITVYAPDMSSAWMLADNPSVSEGATSLNMDFYPAFTAFQFSLASQFASTITVKSFTLSSSDTDIAGTFDATFAADGASTYDNFSGSRDITVSFGSGVDITDTKALRFTVLALPRSISNLSISFNIEVNGTAITRTLPLKTTSPDAFITFDACKKHNISGLLLPSGALKMSVGVAEWTVGAADYNYVSPVATTMRCLTGEKYRRYDSDADYTSWSGSNIVVSYGYKNDSNETINTDDPQEYQEQEHTLLRPAYSPILELATTTDPSTVLELQLDNPHFKFIQYGTDSYGNIDLSIRDHSKEDHLDIISGSGVKTFFSVVPVEQFAIDASDAEKTCRVFLLSVSPGTLHEIPFNMTDDPAPVQALPGEDMNDLMFIYFGPAAYGTTGNEVTP